MVWSHFWHFLAAVIFYSDIFENLLKPYSNIAFKSLTKKKMFFFWGGVYGVLRGFQLGGSAPQTPQGGSAPLESPTRGLGAGMVEFRRLWMIFVKFG